MTTNTQIHEDSPSWYTTNSQMHDEYLPGIPLTHKYMTTNTQIQDDSPSWWLIPLTHKYMTTHLPGIPLTH